MKSTRKQPSGENRPGHLAVDVASAWDICPTLLFRIGIFHPSAVVHRRGYRRSVHFIGTYSFNGLRVITNSGWADQCNKPTFFVSLVFPENCRVLLVWAAVAGSWGGPFGPSARLIPVFHFVEFCAIWCRASGRLYGVLHTKLRQVEERHCCGNSQVITWRRQITPDILGFPDQQFSVRFATSAARNSCNSL